MNSIRRRMAVWMALAVLGGTAAACAAAYVAVRGMLIADFERAAQAQLVSVANAVKVWTDGDIYVELNPALMSGFAAGGDRAAAVWNARTGSPVWQSVSLEVAGGALPRLDGANPEAPVFGTGIAPSGAPAILVAQVTSAQWGWDLEDTAIETAPGVRETQVEITLAIDRTPLDTQLGRLGLLMTLIAVAAALVAAGATFWAVRAVLRPLDDLAARAAAIREPTYDRPFPLDGPAELRPIADRLNDLLARLSDASLAERRFTADAAHELRTPIAELRTMTDVALRYPTAPDQYAHVVKSSNALSIRLSSLIDALLGIARRDAMAAALNVEPVDPVDLLRRSLADRGPLAAARRVQLAVDMPTTHRAMSDPTLLQSIFDNLIGNAVSHAPEGATVRVTYHAQDDGFRLAVANPAPDLGAGDLDMIFQPFWRKDGQRADQDHSGLGLALCRGFADILGLELEARLTPPDRFEIVLSTRRTADGGTSGGGVT